MRIPEHVDVTGRMACGAQYNLQVSSANRPGRSANGQLYGFAGTLRFQRWPLLGGRRGDAELSAVEVSDSERGAWRVEEEFVNAIRGRETITHTDFATGVKYMEFTEAVSRSLQSGETIRLPLL